VNCAEGKRCRCTNDAIEQASQNCVHASHGVCSRPSDSGSTGLGL
jgi:hypothetical protein